MRNRSWQSRRSRLNHDLLKNMYICSLYGWLAFIERDDVDPKKTERFFTVELRQWPHLSREIGKLISEFERSMSPGTLIDCGLLSGLPHSDRAWLRGVVHRAWQVRFGTRELVSKTESLVKRCDLEYARLDKMARDFQIGVSDQDTELVEVVRLFAGTCQELADTIHPFPSSVCLI